MKNVCAKLLAWSIALSAVACDDGNDTGRTSDDDDAPSIRIAFESDTSGTVPADGSTILWMSVRTVDAANDPEDKDVSITAPSGRLVTGSGTLDASGRALTDRTAGGSAAFGFVCGQGELGEVLIRAATDVATTQRKVLCVSEGAFPSLTLTASDYAPLSGGSVTLTARAIDERGLPAGTASGGSSIQFTVDDSAAVLSSATVVPQDGVAEVELTVPTLESTEAQRFFNATASYQASPAAPPIVSSVTIHVVSPTLLVLTPRLSRAAIRSDLSPTDVESSTVLEVVVTKGGVPRTVPVTFTIAAADTERIGFGVRPNLTLTQTVTPDAEGRASRVISAQHSSVRGRASVLLSALDTSQSPAVLATATVEIDVQRAPVVRSLIFESANPPSIGVKGSANPTSTLVSFRIFDDLNEAVSGLQVKFDLPSTADPGATVVGFAVSDSAGRVQTVLSSGTYAAPLQVRATVTTPLATFTTVSDPVAVTAGLPSFSNSYIHCEGVVHVPGEVTDCGAVVADRFTNRGPDMVVQFRAEAGNMTPFGVTDPGDDGEVGPVPAQFFPGEPGSASPDVRDWTYGRLVPLSATDLVTRVGDTFDPDGCFDGSTETVCDLYTMCREGSMPEYCALPIDARTGACWQTIPPLGLELLSITTGRCTRVVSGPNVTISCNDGTSATVPNGPLTGLTYVRNPAAAAAVEALRVNALNCGFPITCLAGKDGVSFLDGLDCVISPGCFDFDPITVCPEAGLVTMTAMVRGEEGFVDLNGNGQFDFTDANGNGRHDVGEAVAEPWADMPEPFVDKNDNCSFDDYAGHPSREPYEEIRLSDIFSDEDVSGDFGYRDPNNTAANALRSFSNGHWDNDKELLLSTRQVYLTSSNFALYGGELCTPADALLGPGGYTCANGEQDTCTQVGARFGIAPCLPRRLVSEHLLAAVGTNAAAAQYAGDVSVAEFNYIWSDANGNCGSPGLEASSDVTVSGRLRLSGHVRVNLDNQYCGISATGAGERNTYRPWCEEYRDLGVKPIDMSIGVVCEAAPGINEVSIRHSGGQEVSLFFDVACPRCGDGIWSPPEMCDPGVPSSEPGYDANCTIDCTIDQP